ncbi:hypothetical protein FS842_005559 [Serendipita sp. 407]|nr:hypothetical protein FS842_005559 [Serendipita sp. 407]
METSTPQEFTQAPSVAPSWGEGRHLADTQSQLQVVHLPYAQSPVNRDYYQSFRDPSHNGHYIDPNTASTSSPTNSSPTGSPYSWDQVRRTSMSSAAAHPLLLAQHTPLIPQPLNASHMHSPVSPYTITHQPPLSLSTAFAGDYSQATQTAVMASPMTYPSPIHTTYGFHPPAPSHYHFGTVGAGDGVGVHRPQLSALTTTLSYQVLQPRSDEYGYGYSHGGSYKMNVDSSGGGNEDGMVYDMEKTSPSLGHFTPTEQHQGSTTGSSSIDSVSSHYGLVNGQPARRPVQTQLLLANAMPSSSSIPMITGRSTASELHQSSVEHTLPPPPPSVPTEPTVTEIDAKVGAPPSNGAKYDDMGRNAGLSAPAMTVDAGMIPSSHAGAGKGEGRLVAGADQTKEVEHDRFSHFRRQTVVGDGTSSACDKAVLNVPDASDERQSPDQRSSNPARGAAPDHDGGGNVVHDERTGAIMDASSDREITQGGAAGRAGQEPSVAPGHVQGRVSDSRERYDISVIDSGVTVRNAVQGDVQRANNTGRMVHINGEDTVNKNVEVNEALTTSTTTVTGNGDTVLHPRIDIDHSYSVPLQPGPGLASPMTNTEMQVAPSLSHFHPHAEPSYGYEYPYARRSDTYSDDPSSRTPSLFKQEWRRSSFPDHPSTTPHLRSGNVVSKPPAAHGPPMSPVSSYDMIHRHSVPNPSVAQESNATLADPQLSQLTGYAQQGGRLIPAAFHAGDSSRGSGSSATSSPPNVAQKSRYSPGSHIVAPSPHYPVPTSQTLEVSQFDDEPSYEPPFSAFSHGVGPASTTMRSYDGDSLYYPAYGSDLAYTPVQTHFDPHGRGSTSPVPSIAGSKRLRRTDWAMDDSRELQRRRLSYSQSIPVTPGVQQYRPSLSPSVGSAVGLPRVSDIAPPSLRDMGIRDAVGEALHKPSREFDGMPRLDDFARDRSRADTSYSFISLPGNTVRKRPRRKFEEITRNYACNWGDCNKAYGTLNHLNAHVVMQKHGPKRTPTEFKELRKMWRKQKREQQAHQQHPHHSGHHHDQNDGYDEEVINLDEDGGSLYNGSV